METVDRDVYFEDVRLQMEAKLWGEEYNRHRPPKQVPFYFFCFFLCCEFLVESRSLVESKLVCWQLFTLGRHYADVCHGNDLTARETSFPPGALHRGAIHQVQLQLWLCERR